MIYLSEHTQLEASLLDWKLPEARDLTDVNQKSQHLAECLMNSRGKEGRRKGGRDQVRAESAGGKHWKILF